MQRWNALYDNGPMDPAATGVPSYPTDTGNSRVVDRANLLPFGLYDDGSVTLAWPQIVQGPRDAKARIEGAMSSGHFNPVDHAIDAFSIASSLPMAASVSSFPTNALASNAGYRLKLPEAARKFIAENYNKMGRDELQEKLGYGHRVIYRELDDILAKAGIEKKASSGGFGRTPSQMEADAALIAQRPQPGPRHTRDPALVDFIRERRNPLNPDGVQSGGQIANAWNALSPEPITRSTVAGIRRDFKIPANMTDPASAFWLATPND